MAAPFPTDRRHALIGQRLADQLGAPVQLVTVQEEEIGCCVAWLSAQGAS